MQESIDKFKLYRRLGVFLESSEGGRWKYVFRTYEPSADRIELSGDFNLWGRLQMRRLDGGIFEQTVESDIMLDGTCYKYRIYENGKRRDRIDRFARCVRSMTANEGIVFTGDDYRWRDGEWMSDREARHSSRQSANLPLNIYEVHLGSWKKRCMGISTQCYFNYRDIAPILAEYVSDMGYTHIWIMKTVSELSEGERKVFSYFAPDSKYGSPEDFKYLVNILHKNNVGVIIELELDKDTGGFSYADFYGSCLDFWITQCHIDGIALKNCRQEEIADINLYLAKDFPSVLKIARDPNRKFRFAQNCNRVNLGFDFVIGSDFFADATTSENLNNCTTWYEMQKIKRSLVRVGDERYIASASRWTSPDRSCALAKMDGEYEEKFLRLKLFLIYTMMLPCKKLTFMGNEIGELNEWEEDGQIEWFLTDYPMHKDLQCFCRALNRLYLENTALWEKDHDPDGIEWYGSGEENVICFARQSGDDKIVGVFNFSREREAKINPPEYLKGRWVALLSVNFPMHTSPVELRDEPLLLPPTSALMLKFCPDR